MNAQLLWLKAPDISSSGYSGGNKILLHPDGTLYALGYFSGDLKIDTGFVKASGPLNYNDQFIAHYNANGQLLWTRNLFEASPYIYQDNFILDLKIDRQGDLIFAGKSLTQSPFLGHSTGSRGSFIAKTDKDLNVKWFNVESFTTIESVGDRGKTSCLAFDKSDNIIWFNNQTALIGNGQFAGGLALTFYNSDGTKTKNQQITSGDGFDYPRVVGITTDKTGNLYITGMYETSINLLEFRFSTASGYPSSFVAKFTPSGVIRWAISGNDASIYASSLSTDGANTLLLTGFGSSNATLNGTTLGASGFVARIDSLGHVLNIFSFDDARPSAATADRDGFIYVTGDLTANTFHYGDYTMYGATEPQDFVFKLNSAGDFIGGYHSNGSGVDVTSTGNSIVTDEGIYTIGTFRSQISWGCKSVSGTLETFYLVKYQLKIPTYSITGPGPECAVFSAQLQLQTDTVTGPYTWHLPAGVTPVSGSITTTGKSLDVNIGIAANNKYGYVTVTKHCDEWYSLPFFFQVLDVPPKPVFTLQPNEICPQNSPTTFAVNYQNSATIFLAWTLPPGASALYNLRKDTANITFPPGYIGGNISVSASNFCGASPNATIPVALIPKPFKPTITGPLSICPGDARVKYAVTDATTVTSFTWSTPNDVFQRPSADTDSISADFALTFTSATIGVIAHGCGDSDPAMFLISGIQPLPKPIISGPSIACSDGRFVLWKTDSLADAKIFQWTYPPKTISSDVNHSTLRASLFDTFISGSLQVKAFNVCNVSTTSDPFLITSVPKPGLPIISGPDQLCENGPRTTYVATAANTVEFFWKIPSILSTDGSIHSEDHVDAIPASAGSGSVSVFGYNSCHQQSKTAFLPVEVYPLLAKPIIQSELCATQLTSNAAGSVEWFKDGKTLDQVTPVITVPDSGTYYVHDRNFCSDVTSDPISVYPVNNNVRWGNVITPNGDGLNDTFLLDKSLTNSSVNILDRWGTSVYRSSNYKNDWRGQGIVGEVYFVSVSNVCLPKPYRGWLRVLD